MGVEHYLICKKCKEYIDLHKAYAFSAVLSAERPPVGVDSKESGFNDVVLRGGYWESRGLWFIWKHREHGSEIEMQTDANDHWYDIEPHLTEKFSHNDDCKIRERVSSTKESK